MFENIVAGHIASKRKLGIVLFGRGGVVLYSNEEANVQLEDVGISVVSGKLASRCSESISSICSAAESCFLRSNQEESWSVLGSGSHGRLIVSYAFTNQLCAPDPRGVIAVIRSPGSSLWKDDERRIMSAFQLTPREAQLGLHLSRGAGLRDFAEQKYLTIHTVKTHLKQLFRKTGAKKQLQVAVLVLAALR